MHLPRVKIIPSEVSRPNPRSRPIAALPSSSGLLTSLKSGKMGSPASQSKWLKLEFPTILLIARVERARQDGLVPSLAISAFPGLYLPNSNSPPHQTGLDRKMVRMLA